MARPESSMAERSASAAAQDRRLAAITLRWLGHLGRFAAHLLRRFKDNGCLSAAGALSYTTLVSLVPLLAISLAVFSAFPIFEKLRDKALSFLFDAFVPRIGGTVETYIGGFAASAGRTTALGVIVLAVTAIMLLATIESRLNVIWQVPASRGWLARVTIYWTLLTLGPLIFGLALSISTSVHLAAGSFGMAGTALLPFLARLPSLLTAILPILLQSLGLTLLYALIPNCPVRWRDGLTGAVAASILLDICRAGFTVFIDHYNSYEPVYGALAVIPIFLLWMYLSWIMVLIGAEIAAALPLWGVEDALGRGPDLPDLELALRLFEALTAQARRGFPARQRVLIRLARASAGAVVECLAKLQAAGLVAATIDGGFVLARDLGQVTLAEVDQALTATDQAVAARHVACRHTLDRRLAPIRQAEAEALAAPVAQFIAASEDRRSDQSLSAERTR